MHAWTGLPKPGSPTASRRTDARDASGSRTGRRTAVHYNGGLVLTDGRDMESTDFSAGIRAALDRGDHAQALTDATTAVSEHPGSALAWRLLAAAQRGTGDDTQALASIDRVVGCQRDGPACCWEHA